MRVTNIKYTIVSVQLYRRPLGQCKKEKEKKEVVFTTFFSYVRHFSHT